MRMTSIVAAILEAAGFCMRSVAGAFIEAAIK